MKRFLLAPLLLTLIFSLAIENVRKKRIPLPILSNLNDHSVYRNGVLIYEVSLSEEDYQYGPILISFDKSFGWVIVDHKRLLTGLYGNRADYEFHFKKGKIYQRFN